MLDYNTEFTVNTVDMNLAETCNYLQINTINAINEFQTTVLLSEYGYLLENGCEIDYDTDGNDIITEGVMDLFTKIKEWIKVIFKKLMSWIQEQIEKTRQWFLKIGIPEQVARKTVYGYDEIAKYLSDEFKPTFSGIWINVSDMENEFPKMIKSFNTSLSSMKLDENTSIENLIQKELKKYYTSWFSEKKMKKIEKNTPITGDQAMKAFANVYMSKANVVQSVLNTQNNCIQFIEETARALDKTDNRGALMQKSKIQIRAISQFTVEIIKIYKDGMTASIRLLKELISTMKNISDEEAENIIRKKQSKFELNAETIVKLFGLGLTAVSVAHQAIGVLKSAKGIGQAWGTARQARNSGSGILKTALTFGKNVIKNV